MKTFEQWRASGKPLNTYLRPGDIIDRFMARHFIELLPERARNTELIQVAEPHNNIDGLPTMATVERTGRGWVWRGYCLPGQTVRPAWIEEAA